VWIIGSRPRWSNPSRVLGVVQSYHRISQPGWSPPLNKSATISLNRAHQRRSNGILKDQVEAKREEYQLGTLQIF